jgi:hypothetical protein
MKFCLSSRKDHLEKFAVFSYHGTGKAWSVAMLVAILKHYGRKLAAETTLPVCCSEKLQCPTIKANLADLISLGQETANRCYVT